MTSLFPKEKNCSSFEVDHNFQTPLKVCEYMVDMVPPGSVTILEPTPGLGNIVSVLKQFPQYKVTAADDFFLFDTTQRFDTIVMNPPFTAKSAHVVNAPHGAETKGMKLGYYILLECMKMSDNVIALMPWFTLADSDVRMRTLKGYGIKSLTALPRKTFEFARVQTVIIELVKGHKPETIFRTFYF